MQGRLQNSTDKRAKQRGRGKFVRVLFASLAILWTILPSPATIGAYLIMVERMDVCYGKPGRNLYSRTRGSLSGRSEGVAAHSEHQHAAGACGRRAAGCRICRRPVAAHRLRAGAGDTNEGTPARLWRMAQGAGQADAAHLRALRCAAR